MTFRIRNEEARDFDKIHEVTDLAFRDAPHSSGTEAQIIDDLRADQQLTISLVAEENGTIIGHVAISPVQISSLAKGWYGLGPISVDPSQQRKGVGSRLMRQAISQVQSLGANGLVLLGDPAYYARFGFESADPLVLAGVPQEYFQSLRFTDDLPSGEVTYHRAFGAAAS